MLKVLNLRSGYGNLIVLKGISIHVSKGEIVTIIGANGAGKTTLLKTISGLIQANSGEINFGTEKINHKEAEDILSLGCALVPEGRQVFNTLTVKENLVLGSYIKLKKRESKFAKDTLEEIYSLFPILKERGKQLAGTLSGGEQQMLSIGRALMSKPSLLMMDEPFMGIAPIIVKQIIKTIVKLKESGITMLLVEQNAKAALNIADRGYVLETGQIVLEGSSKELLNNQDVQRAYLGKDYKKIDE
jgi:branched-chain amino acid transport system ATP-binding protein